jgi:hypothetical protein
VFFISVISKSPIPNVGHENSSVHRTNRARDHNGNLSKSCQTEVFLNVIVDKFPNPVIQT